MSVFPFFRPSGKLKFEVRVVIAELANIPMVNGYVFVKWKLLSGGDNAGVTARSLPFFSFFFFRAQPFLCCQDQDSKAHSGVDS